jgi:hypothetical protein
MNNIEIIFVTILFIILLVLVYLPIYDCYKLFKIEEEREKKIKYTENKIISVVWIDSGISVINRWENPEEILKDIDLEKKPVKTVGFLLKEDDDWIVLATSLNERSINGGFAVYKKNIIERKEYDF